MRFELARTDLDRFDLTKRRIKGAWRTGSKILFKIDRKTKEVLSLMKLIKEDLQGPEIAALLNEHLREMEKHSPPESIHALDLNKLRQPNIHFWSLWDEERIVGCGALKLLDARHAEIKSMRVTYEYRGKGIAKTILSHLIEAAASKGVEKLSLETGSMAAFEPARNLYLSFGFEFCEPFDSYIEDENSVFMTKQIN